MSMAANSNDCDLSVGRDDVMDGINDDDVYGGVDAASTSSMTVTIALDAGSELLERDFGRKQKVEQQNPMDADGGNSEQQLAAMDDDADGKVCSAKQLQSNVNVISMFQHLF